LTAVRVRSTFHIRESSMSPLAVLTKLTAMLRVVPAVRLVFAKFAALRRSKESVEPLASEFLSEASDVPEARLISILLFCSRPATMQFQHQKRTVGPRESS
jgi:hypothetical protein